MNTSNVSPQVIKMSTSFNVDDMPDAKDLADQYGVDYEEEEDGNMSKDSQEVERMVEEVKRSQEENIRVEKLITKLDNKNKEIERLCVLLETIEMVPGADPNKYLDVIDGNDQEVDFRDTKIVHLAKKCRNLTVLLNKERGLKEKTNKELITLQEELDRTKRELELVSTPAARAAARQSLSGDKTNEGTPRKDTKKELAQALKQVDEWRKKAQVAQEEAKKLNRALAKELGDGVTTEEAVDEGWKGRAQQIVLLKSKVARLERDKESTMKSSAAKTRLRSSTTKTVDEKAEEELNSMSQERQQAVEALTEDHARLTEECQQLTQKVERGKARVRALESDAVKHKTQLKVLVEKAESDDSLIEALQEELKKVSQEAATFEKKYKEAAMNSTGTRPLREVVAVKGKDGGKQVELSGVNEDPAAELARLRRLVTQQGAQLETQETIIRQLRAKNSRK